MNRFLNSWAPVGLVELILILGYLSHANAQTTAIAEPSAERTSSPMEYVKWLESRSMLSQSGKLSRDLSGKSAQWHHEFAEPQPRAAIQQASVWLLSYPASVITRRGETVIATWGDDELWNALNEIGVD